MIPQNMMMCKETRTLLTELELLASEHSITKLVTPSEIMMGDLLCLRFYTAPALNVIKQRIKKMKKLSSKNFETTYWIDILTKILVNQSGTMREYVVGIPGSVDSFTCVSKYLITDYSIKDAYNIYKLITTHTPEIINSAIITARNQKVYNIHYIKAIIERMNAESNIRRTEIQAIIDREERSNKILHKEKVSNTEEDVVNAINHWNSTKENAELEKKIKELYGDIDEA